MIIRRIAIQWGGSNTCIGRQDTWLGKTRYLAVVFQILPFWVRTRRTRLHPSPNFLFQFNLAKRAHYYTKQALYNNIMLKSE